MSEIVQLAIANLLNPAVLFFVLGMGAGLLRSDLVIPEAIAKGLSIYLMIAIGLKGGVAVREHPVDPSFFLAMIVGLALSFGIPFLAFSLLRIGTKLKTPDAAALSAHYGSVSVVTFVTAVGVLNDRSIPYEGFMVAVMAIMETPAIMSGLLIASWFSVNNATSGNNGGMIPRELVREIFLSSSVVLLLGSFVIGMVTGPPGMSQMEPFIVAPFYGILCIFLLDMGLVASRRLLQSKALTPGVIAFGIYMPLIGALLGLMGGWLAGLSTGGMTLLMVLAASASYIAVPAAMRLAIPKANPAVYITMALAVTFPFNIIIGIPLYIAIVQIIAGAP